MPTTQTLIAAIAALIVGRLAARLIVVLAGVCATVIHNMRRGKL